MGSRTKLVLGAALLLVLSSIGAALVHSELRELADRQAVAERWLRASTLLSPGLSESSTTGELSERIARAKVVLRDGPGARSGVTAGAMASLDTLSFDPDQHEATEARLRRVRDDLLHAATEKLHRGRRRTDKLGDDLRRALLFGGPLLTLVATGILIATIFLPLRRAARAPTPAAAAHSLQGLSGSLGEALRALDDERRERVLDLIRAGHLAALGTLAAGIAHEVRNPLMAIRGTAESARRSLGESADSQDLREGLLRIENESERAGQLLRDLLSLAPREPAEAVRFDLIAEVQEAARIATARWRVGADAVRITGLRHHVLESQPSRWRQILFNLIANALEASRGPTKGADVEDDGTTSELPNGAVRVRVELVAGALQVEVSDDGRGFDATLEETLFEPFFSTRPDGSGLGLFVCRSLAKELGGELSAQSEGLGKGARFRLLFPRKEGHG